MTEGSHDALMTMKNSTMHTMAMNSTANTIVTIIIIAGNITASEEAGECKQVSESTPV